MKALVVYGSRNGSTKCIAEEICSVLLDEGIEAELADAKGEVQNVERYDLVVVGSGLYKGSWLKEAVEFVRKNQAVLKTRSVWLFSSGLRFEDPHSLSPKIIGEFRSDIDLRDHQFFPGSLDLQNLRWLHRVILQMPGIRSIFPHGDFRDWSEIRTWAKRISQSHAARLECSVRINPMEAQTISSSERNNVAVG